MSRAIKLTADDLALRFPVFPEDTPPPRFTMDEYYRWVLELHRTPPPRSPEIAREAHPGPCPVRLRLD